MSWGQTSDGQTSLGANVFNETGKRLTGKRLGGQTSFTIRANVQRGKWPEGQTSRYLADKLCRSAGVQGCSRLRSKSSSCLSDRHSDMPALSLHSGWSVLPALVAGHRLWNNSPQHVTSAPSLQVSKIRLESHSSNNSFPWTLVYCGACRY